MLGPLGLDVDRFMFMGEAGAQGCRLPDGVAAVWLYKHGDTRRYLNLDGAGHAYRYVPPADPYGDVAGSYAPLPDALGAARAVLS